MKNPITVEQLSPPMRRLLQEIADSAANGSDFMSVPPHTRVSKTACALANRRLIERIDFRRDRSHRNRWRLTEAGKEMAAQLPEAPEL
jgi:hypothetical protein